MTSPKCRPMKIDVLVKLQRLSITVFENHQKGLIWQCLFSRIDLFESSRQKSASTSAILGHEYWSETILVIFKPLWSIETIFGKSGFHWNWLLGFWLESMNSVKKQKISFFTVAFLSVKHRPEKYLQRPKRGLKTYRSHRKSSRQLQWDTDLSFSCIKITFVY